MDSDDRRCPSQTAVVSGARRLNVRLRSQPGNVIQRRICTGCPRGQPGSGRNCCHTEVAPRTPGLVMARNNRLRPLTASHSCWSAHLRLQALQTPLNTDRLNRGTRIQLTIQSGKSVEVRGTLGSTLFKLFVLLNQTLPSRYRSPTEAG
jgi:hypothetical protein